MTKERIRKKEEATVLNRFYIQLRDIFQESDGSVYQSVQCYMTNSAVELEQHQVEF